MTAASALDADAFDARDLPSAVLAPHDLALAALKDPDPGPLAAVAWCSAHLVAVHRVLYAAARRRLPDGQDAYAPSAPPTTVCSWRCAGWTAGSPATRTCP